MANVYTVIGYVFFSFAACSVRGEKSEFCEANLTIKFPNGETTSLDFCQKTSMEATYEFDPDASPTIRQPVLVFSAVQDDGFECQIQISEPKACGTGYYRINGTSGSIDFITLDCSDTPDEFEGIYSGTSGYLRFDELNAGEESGNFTGTPLLTSVSGYITTQSNNGIRVFGDFTLRREIIGADNEGEGCVVSDGDEDQDGVISSDFGGEDCDDSDPLKDIEDCNGICRYSGKLGDGSCNDGGFGSTDFDCEELNYDNGDCQ